MQLADSVFSALKDKPEGILVRDDGGVHTLRHTDLVDIQLRPNDLYIVGPHGEILPPIALAVRQNIARMDDGLCLHIDAHRDSCRTRNNGEREFNSVRAAALITDFLEAPDEQSSRQAFHALVRYIKGDVAVFLHAMKNIIPNFSAFIRHECNYLNESKFYGPYDLDNYLCDQGVQVRNELFLQSVIDQTRIAVYSIDADFCGTTLEGEKVASPSNFEMKMNFLITALGAQMRKSRANRERGEQDQDPLYFLSIDPNWCKFWKRFLSRFLSHFYEPLIGADN
jgi:hypothetical protein